MKNFINLMPHAVRLRRNTANTAAEPDELDIVVEPRRDVDGKPAPARVPSTPSGQLPDLGGIAAFDRTQYGAVEGLPEPSDGTIHLVSIMFAGRVGDRDDVFIPGTGPRDGTVRDAAGQVYAVTRLVKA